MCDYQMTCKHKIFLTINDNIYDHLSDIPKAAWDKQYYLQLTKIWMHLNTRTKLNTLTTLLSKPMIVSIVSTTYTWYAAIVKGLNNKLRKLLNRHIFKLNAETQKLLNMQVLFKKSCCIRWVKFMPFPKASYGISKDLTLTTTASS